MKTYFIGTLSVNSTMRRFPSQIKVKSLKEISILPIKSAREFIYNIQNGNEILK